MRNNFAWLKPTGCDKPEIIQPSKVSNGDESSVKLIDDHIIGYQICFAGLCSVFATVPL